MNQNYPTKPVSIVLADGAERRLRFGLGAVKAIKEKFAAQYPPDAQVKDAVAQSPVLKALGDSPETALPYMLMLGLVEKEGLTEQKIADELLSGDMIEYASMQVIESFFGRRIADVMREAQTVQDAIRRKAIETAIAAIAKTNPTTTAAVQ